MLNTLRPRQNGRHFAYDTFKCIFVNEKVRISIKFSLKFVPKVPINNIPALVQIMAWRRPGDKPLSEPVMVSLLTHICVTPPQWVKQFFMSLVWCRIVVTPLQLIYWSYHSLELSHRWQGLTRPLLSSPFVWTALQHLTGTLGLWCQCTMPGSTPEG